MGMRNDVQVVATVLSVEQDVPPDIPAMIGASAAIAVSDIPWAGPIGGVSVGLVDGEIVINPNQEQRAVSKLSLTVAGTDEAVLMVEAGAKEISEADMLRAILTGHEEIKKLVAFQKQIVAEIGKEKRVFPVAETGEDVKAAVRADFFDRCAWAFEAFDRHERSAREEQVKQEAHELYAERFEGRLNEVDDALYYLNKEIMRTKILEKGVRPDGRSLTQIRPIWCETGVLPRVHGSGRVHPRRNAGALHRDACARERSAGDRGSRHGDQRALHAQLQHAAVFHRRGRPSQEPRPPRNRPWRAGQARA